MFFVDIRVEGKPLDPNNPKHVVLATVYMMWAWEMWRAFEEGLKRFDPVEGLHYYIRAVEEGLYKGSAPAVKMVHKWFFDSVMPATDVKGGKSEVYVSERLGKAWGIRPKSIVYVMDLRSNFQLSFAPGDLFEKLRTKKHPIIRVTGRV